MKIRKIIFTSLLTLAMTSGSFFSENKLWAQLGGVIQQLVENGNAQSSFKSSDLNFKLFCPGNVECGSVNYANLQVSSSGAGNSKLTLTANVQITMGTSSVLARNCSFVANSLAGSLSPLDPSSGNIPYAIFMPQCDPIQASEATGNFAPAHRLTYRGLVEFNGLNLVLSRSSVYVISTGN